MRSGIKPSISSIAGLKQTSLTSSESSSTVEEHEPDELHDAQLRKVNHILAKARLQDGQRLLEIGSGWGELAIQACRSADVQVDTITLSSDQKELAEQRIAAAGLSSRIRVHLMDYRQMPESWQGAFDRVISIEMVEAVGIEFLPEYFKWIDWALKRRGGVGVIQGITMPETRFEAYRSSLDFIRKWIFPGGICPTVSSLVTSLDVGSKHQLVIESIDNIGPHYARTLREWARRFEACFDSHIAPTLRKQYPTVMDGPNGAEELQVFRRKWMCTFSFAVASLLHTLTLRHFDRLLLLLRDRLRLSHARRCYHDVHSRGGRVVRVQRLRVKCSELLRKCNAYSRLERNPFRMYSTRIC